MAQDDGDWLDASVEVVTSEADIAEITRSRRAGHIKKVLEETETILIGLQSQWQGNEYVGDWYKAWFVTVDFDTGAAIHITEGVDAGYPVSRLEDADWKAGTSGYSTRSARQTARRAFDDWERVEEMRSHHYVEDTFCPVSAIEFAIRTPERESHYVFEGGTKRHGAIREGDLQIMDTRMYEWKPGHRDEKLVVKGDTYEAFKECHLGDAIPFSDVVDESGEVIEEGCYQTYDGQDQLIAKEGLPTFVEYATEAGFTVSVHEDFEEYLRDC